MSTNRMHLTTNRMHLFVVTVVMPVGLIDAFRQQHPRNHAFASRHDACFSWRGTPGKVLPEAGRFYDRGVMGEGVRGGGHG